MLCIYVSVLSSHLKYCLLYVISSAKCKYNVFIGPIQLYWNCDSKSNRKLKKKKKKKKKKSEIYFAKYLIGTAVSEKKIFEKCEWTTNWPRSRDDLDLN